jgi:hypothetical protein
MSEPTSLEDKEFEIAIGILEDCRRLIAAGKVQRWEVLKWGVSVNLALAVAASTSDLIKLPTERKQFLLYIGIAVLLACFWLIVHYNTRMTRARRQTRRIAAWLLERGLDYYAIAGVGRSDYSRAGKDYDFGELTTFLIVLAASVFAIFLVLSFFQG